MSDVASEPVAPAQASAEQGASEESESPEASGVKGFFKRFSKSAPSEAEEPVQDEPVAAPAVPEPQPEVSVAAKVEVPQEKPNFFARIKRGLSRTSTNFAEGLGNLVLGQKEIDEDLLEEIETQLLVADVGMEATSDIIDDLTSRVARKELADSGALYTALQASLKDLLTPVEKPLEIATDNKPYVILVVGVNGVGKTTTIGKLAKRLQSEGKSVMLAAGDTFRAAAVEQLQVWGERNNVPVVAQHTGADSASVIFDAVQSAQSRQIDVVIADTAGRLHNKSKPDGRAG